MSWTIPVQRSVPKEEETGKVSEAKVDDKVKVETKCEPSTPETPVDGKHVTFSNKTTECNEPRIAATRAKVEKHQRLVTQDTVESNADIEIEQDQGPVQVTHTTSTESVAVMESKSEACAAEASEAHQEPLETARESVSSFKEVPAVYPQREVKQLNKEP